MAEHLEMVFEEDPHTVAENADFSALDKLYEGRKVYYGDFHSHANTGGSSDGKATLKDWLHAMKELKMDFSGIMDHRQVMHMYLEDFDPEYFLYGTEPWVGFEDKGLSCHYLMVFPEREALGRVLHKFPDVYEFTGETDVGPSFKYKKTTQARFLEICQAVKEEGGVVIHPHPRQVMQSEDIQDYYFGEGCYIESIYAYNFPYVNNIHSLENYQLWVDLLNSGRKVYTSATNDAHGLPGSYALNAVYSEKKWGPAYTEYLVKGDVNAGYMGIKMSVDSTPVGSTVKYREGMKLYVKLGDVHPCRFDKDDTYRIDVMTDKGLAYSEKVNLPYSLALNVEKGRKYYRVVIIRESDGGPAAIGNPVFIEE